MNKLYVSLLISAGVILLITLLIYVLLPIMSYETPTMFILLPILTMTMLASLGMLVKQQVKKNKPIGVSEILVIRIVMLIPFIGILITGIILNKEQIVVYVILFIIYYLVFAFTETRTLIKLTQNQI